MGLSTLTLDDLRTALSQSNLGGSSASGQCAVYLLRWSAGVRACPPLFVGVVTQLDAHVRSQALTVCLNHGRVRCLPVSVLDARMRLCQRDLRPMRSRQ